MLTLFSMNEPIIQIRGIGKKYNIAHAKGGYVALRDVLTSIAKSPFRFFKQKAKEATGLAKAEEFWALKDISLNIQKGDIVGIIGSNGAGKSTLLKILTGITPPTEGEIRMNGRVASLLEVGTGFHPELTGRENIFLNGAILGMTKKEIASKFDEIVAFAGIEKFLDTPVKRYSSGMYVRLAFSVAAHMEPDILLVDEVLAVGDAEFQKKCLGKMEEVTKTAGRTILFVSHNMAAIQQLCNKCVWFQNGKIRAIGDSSEIITDYLNDALTTDPWRAINHEMSGAAFMIKDVLIRNSSNVITRTLKPNEPFTVEVRYRTDAIIKKPFFWIDIAGVYGHLFGANMLFDNLAPDEVSGEGIISCHFSGSLLLPQMYTVTLRVVSENGTDRIIPAMINVTSFQVTGSVKEYGMTGSFAEKYLNHDTPMIIPYTWTHPNGITMVPPWQHGS